MPLLRLTLLTLAWCALTREFTVGNLLVGAMLSFGVLTFAGYGQRPRPSLSLFERAPDVLRLVASFAVDLVVSNIKIAAIVLVPGRHARPAIIDVPIDVRSDEELALLSDLVTLTPGTLMLDVSDDRRTLYVHVMEGENADAARRALADGIVLRVRRVFA